MAAATYDLLIEQGATFRFTAVYGHKTFDSNGQVVVDAQGNVVYTPYDITGCKARMQVRQRRGSKVLVSATTSNGGIEIPVGTDGKLRVTITDEATDSLDIAKARYDLEISYPSGDVVRVLQGNVRISPNITQDADLDDISDQDSGDFDVDEQDVDADKLVTSQPSTAF